MDGPVAWRKGIRLVSGLTIIILGHVNFLDKGAGSGLGLGVGIGIRVGLAVAVFELAKAACEDDED